MNNLQLPSYNVTADLVHRNQANNLEPPVIINDIFDIPDTAVITIPRNDILPTILSTPNLISQRAPAPAPVAPVPAPAPAPVPAPVAPASNPPPVNFIKAINHSAMTDIMNTSMTRNTPQQQITTSVSTKKTDTSVPVNITNNAMMNSPHHNSSQVQSRVHNQVQSHGNGANPNSCNKVSTTRTAPIKNTKILIEDEDKDTAIDYDDDDPEIKKIKLSLFHFAKDITFNLIFTIPFLRTKLNNILREPTLAINQIEQVFDEFKDLLNRQQLESIKKYVCEDGIRDKLNYILESGFNKILSDGKIDINDAPQFNQLVYFIIKSFNNINQGKVYRFYVSKEHVMLLLHFILKSVFTLTLKGDEEQMAIGLLDTSFKLVQIEVLPLISKRWFHRFRLCHSVREIDELIE
jgi:hypothetical protein